MSQISDYYVGGEVVGIFERYHNESTTLSSSVAGSIQLEPAVGCALPASSADSRRHIPVSSCLSKQAPKSVICCGVLM